VAVVGLGMMVHNYRFMPQFVKVKELVEAGVRQASGAFVPLSHYFAMTGEWTTGLRVYERLFAYARKQGKVRFCTVSRLVESLAV
jgi:predicted dehydrogenase